MQVGTVGSMPSKKHVGYSKYGDRYVRITRKPDGSWDYEYVSALKFYLGRYGKSALLIIAAFALGYFTHWWLPISGFTQNVTAWATMVNEALQHLASWIRHITAWSVIPVLTLKS